MDRLASGFNPEEDDAPDIGRKRGGDRATRDSRERRSVVAHDSGQQIQAAGRAHADGGTKTRGRAQVQVVVVLVTRRQEGVGTVHRMSFAGLYYKEIAGQTT
jgi:hypothetical protein